MASSRLKHFMLDEIADMTMEDDAETQTQEETAKVPKYVFCLLVMV